MSLKFLQASLRFFRVHNVNLKRAYKKSEWKKTEHLLAARGRQRPSLGPLFNLFSFHPLFFRRYVVGYRLTAIMLQCFLLVVLVFDIRYSNKYKDMSGWRKCTKYILHLGIDYLGHVNWVYMYVCVEVVCVCVYMCGVWWVKLKLMYVGSSVHMPMCPWVDYYWGTSSNDVLLASCGQSHCSWVTVWLALFYCKWNFLLLLLRPASLSHVLQKGPTKLTIWHTFAKSLKLFGWKFCDSRVSVTASLDLSFISGGQHHAAH